MSNYFTVRDGKMVSLMVIRNTPTQYEKKEASSKHSAVLAGSGKPSR